MTLTGGYFGTWCSPFDPWRKQSNLVIWQLTYPYNQKYALHKSFWRYCLQIHYLGYQSYTWYPSQWNIRRQFIYYHFNKITFLQFHLKRSCYPIISGLNLNYTHFDACFWLQNLERKELGISKVMYCIEIYGKVNPIHFRKLDERLFLLSDNIRIFNKITFLTSHLKCSCYPIINCWTIYIMACKIAYASQLNMDVAGSNLFVKMIWLSEVTA